MSGFPRVFKDKKEVVFLFLLAFIVILSYYPALFNGFVGDDNTQISKNRNITSWQYAPRIFTIGVWHEYEGYGGFYRPLAFFSWLVENSLAGLNPFVFHLDNVLLHIICAFMAYFVVRELLGDRKTAFLSSLIFALHPVNVESVAWVSARMELLYLCLLLAAFWFFIKRCGKPFYIFLSCFLYFLALLSKEAAVTLPLIIAAYLFVFERPVKGAGSFIRAAKLISPYIAVTVIYFLIRTLVVGTGVRVTAISFNYAKLGPFNNFLAMLQALYEYVRLAFLPFGLRSEYLYPPPGIFSFRVVFPVLAVLILIAASRKILEASRPASFAIIWFFVGLLPVSNIIPTGILVAERALYLPSLGACMLLGLGLSKLDFRRPYALVLVIVLLASFSAGTFKRSGFWSAGKHYAEQAENSRKRIEVFPGEVTSYERLASFNLSIGDYGKETEEAIITGLKIGPDYANLHAIYADLYDVRSEPEKALEEELKAIKLKPLPKYYHFAGLLYQQLGNLREARRMFDEAVRLEPANAEFYMSKAGVLAELKDYGQAMALYEEAAKLDPGNPYIYMGQAVVLSATGRKAEAVGKMRTSVRLSPRVPEFHYLLAVAYRDAGAAEIASTEAKEALRLRPDYKEARALLDSLAGVQ